MSLCFVFNLYILKKLVSQYCNVCEHFIYYSLNFDNESGTDCPMAIYNRRIHGITHLTSCYYNLQMLDFVSILESLIWTFYLHHVCVGV